MIANLNKRFKTYPAESHWATFGANQPLLAMKKK